MSMVEVMLRFISVTLSNQITQHMRKLVFAMLAVLFLSVTESHAGFLVKKHAAATTLASSHASVPPAVSSEMGASFQNAERKQSFAARLLNVVKPKSAAIPQVLYIILAIFPLGWLGMGINDNFEGWHWIVSLLLYILAWLPGLIYTLVMMKNYY